MDILKAIYKGEYSVERQPTKEYYAVWRKNTELMDKLSPYIGEDVIDQINTSFAAMTDIENYENFLAGLRLGIAVMQAYYQ